MPERLTCVEGLVGEEVVVAYFSEVTPAWRDLHEGEAVLVVVEDRESIRYGSVREQRVMG